MPSADVSPRNSIQVGIISPTGPQTLLNLLKLYESDNTDYPTWVETLESHVVTLLPFLAARPPNQLLKWHDAFTFEDLRRQVDALEAEARRLAGGHHLGTPPHLGGGDHLGGGGHLGRAPPSQDAPPSRPTPEDLTPPKGARNSRIIGVFTQTTPERRP